eukprot:UN03698
MQSIVSFFSTLLTSFCEQWRFYGDKGHIFLFSSWFTFYYSFIYFCNHLNLLKENISSYTLCHDDVFLFFFRDRFKDHFKI